MLTREAAPIKAGRKEWIGLAMIAVPCLIYAMDLTVLHLAMPTIAADFQPSAAQLLWMVDIYGFMVAGFLITMGTLGDRVGRRRLLLIGAGAFAAASVLAAFASSAPMLIAARALLGVAGATVAPSTLSLIRNMFLNDNERTFAIGVWVACFSAGAALGPLVGGALMGLFWWGSVFLINVPFLIALIVFGPMFLPEYRDPKAGSIDLLSALLCVVTVLSVIHGIKHMAEGGVSLPAVLPIVAGLLIGWLFLRRQRTLADPMIDMALFASPAFAVTMFINVLAIFLAFAVFFFVAQYFQLVAGLDPLTAGLWTAPGGVACVLSSLSVGMLTRFARPPTVIAAAFALVAIALAIMAQGGGPDGFWMIFLGYVLLAMAFGPVGALTTDLVMSLVPPEKAGAASGISETSFEFGAALGIALPGSLITVLYSDAMAKVLASGAAGTHVEAARDTLAGAVALAQRLPADVAVGLLAAARAAYVDAFAVTAMLGVALAVAGVVIALTLMRRAGERAGGIPA